MGSHVTEILHRFRLIEDAKTPCGEICGIFEIEKILEGKLFEARGGEGGEFGAGERPGHLAFGVGGLAASGDDEQNAAQAKESRNFFDRPGAEGGSPNLACIGLKDKTESATPGGWRIEQVG